MKNFIVIILLLGVGFWYYKKKKADASGTQNSNPGLKSAFLTGGSSATGSGSKTTTTVALNPVDPGVSAPSIPSVSSGGDGVGGHQPEIQQQQPVAFSWYSKPKSAFR